MEDSELPVSGSLTTTIKTAASTSSNDNKPQILSNIVINGSNNAAINPMVKKELQKVLASNLSKQNVIRILPQQVASPQPQLQPMQVDEQPPPEPATNETPAEEGVKPVKEEGAPSDEEARPGEEKDDSFVVTPDYIQQSKSFRELYDL